MDVFEQAVSLTLQHEGGYSSDPFDPGNWTGGRRGVGVGELHGTKYGISAAAYPTLDIAALTVSEAIAIYRRDYWQKPRFDQVGAVDAPIAVRLFDLGVNCGPRTAARMLQRALHVVCCLEVPPQREAAWRQAVARILLGKVLAIDGLIGPVTLNVLRACPHRTAVLMALRGEAYIHYKALNPAAIPGWLNRLGA